MAEAAARRQGPPGGLRQLAAPGQLGDDYSLLFDPVQRYNYFKALQVGRVLDEYGYVSFEDPIPTTEMEALVELRKNSDTPIGDGYRASDCGQHRRDHGLLPGGAGMPCTPHNWGNGFDLAVHFQLELAVPNCYWFEMPWPWEYVDRPYMAKIRADADGYVHAPTDPGLGYPLDRAAMEKITKRIDR